MDTSNCVIRSSSPVPSKQGRIVVYHPPEYDSDSAATHSGAPTAEAVSRSRHADAPPEKMLGGDPKGRPFPGVLRVHCYHQSDQI